MPLTFFVLLVAVSLPIWILAALPADPLRGVLPFNLPISALVAFCPVVAASIVELHRGGLKGIRDLLKRAVDYQPAHRSWYLIAMVVMPTILMLAYIVMRLTGRPLPPDPRIPLATAPLLFALFLIPALGEELGWQGHAFEPMQRRFGPLQAACLLGAAWAIWHSISFLQTGQPMRWILWQSVTTVALRVLLVWVYINAGRSVLAASVLHASSNVSEFGFPNSGSHYDPFVASLIMWILVGLIAVRGGLRPRTRVGCV